MHYQSKISENAKLVLQKRYLAKDEKGRVMESIPQMFERVAGAVASAEFKYVKDRDIGQENFEESFRTFKKMMEDLDFLPNSPTLMNAGRPLGQLSACFVLPVGDSMEEIFDTVKNAALIHKSGGGTGFSFSRLRPCGSAVRSTGGVASGPVSFMKVFNAATEAVKQGGTRRGANMGILRVDHPDILQFIDCKNNTHEINNFNISVAITDEFMTALRNGDVYALKDPHTNDIVGSLDAQEVFAKITYSAWRTGEPGVVFIDRINQKSPLTMMGLIESTNPCGEQPLLPYEACNLGSINLLNHVVLNDDGAPVSFDFKKLEYTTANAVRFLDNVIDVNNYPLPEIDQMTRSTRKIGLGVMGFADTLLMLGIPYNSEEGVAFAKKVMQCIENAAWEQSRYLARVRGPFPAIGQSDFATYEAPVRNATVTTIAPTGTISMIAGVSSGIEPIFAYAYIRNIMDGAHMIETNNILRDYLENYSGFDADTIEAIKKRVADEGTVAHIEEIPEEIRKVFVCAHDIDPTAHVRMQDAFQQFTDNAVSKTINFPNSATLHDVQTAYRMAYYETSCKGLTVYRDGSRESQVLNIKAVNDEKKAAETETTTIDLGITPMKDAVTTASIQPRDRGEELDGFTRKVPIGCGKLYITINHDDKGICEVFTNNGKGGGCPSQSEATARLASIALRAGISVDAVIEQLKGIRCPSCQRNGNVKVLSCPDAIGRLLEEAVKRIEMEGCQMEQGKNPAPILPKEATESFQGSVDDNALNDADVKFAKKCPECGASLEHEGGCVICRSCGFSKCG